MKSRQLWAVVLVAMLVAAAFFLPERLLLWGDRQLVDSLHMETQNEDREGLAESIQLTVPEKVMLLRSSRMNVMDLKRTEWEGLYYSLESEGVAIDYQNAQAADQLPELREEDLARYNEALALWNGRLAAVRGEIHSLQTLGGLPEVWNQEAPAAYAGCTDLLYLDQESQMSFQVYQMTLLWNAYNMTVLVDAQSGRILSFALTGSANDRPAWGSRGASNFGSAWRDYWQMDSVSTGWYNEHTRSILESTAAPENEAGYAALDQVTFLYDGQSQAVPLDCQGSRGRYFSVSWNR